MIDNKGRLFGKINIIDLLILAILIGGAAFAGHKFLLSDKNAASSQADRIEITFYSAEVPEYAALSAKVGDPVKDPAKGNFIGTVKEIKVGKSDSYATNEKGEWILSPKPGYASIYITVSGTGVFGDNGVIFGNSPYFTGNSLEIKVGNSAFWTRIYSITKKE